MPNGSYTRKGEGFLGGTFQSYPHPNVIALDRDTILFKATGTYSGIHNRRWDWKVTARPIGVSATPKIAVVRPSGVWELMVVEETSHANPS